MAQKATLDDNTEKKAAALPADPQNDRGAGDNGGLTQALFLFHVGELEKLDNNAKRAKGKYDAANKKAKADGVILDDFKTAKALAALEPEEILDRHNTITQYLIWMGVEIAKHFPIIKQNDLRQLPFSEEEQVSNAEQDGLRAGLKGKNYGDNPHGMETSTGQAWARGWHQGQDKIMKEMGLVQTGVEADLPEEAPSDDDDDDEVPAEETDTSEAAE